MSETTSNGCTHLDQVAVLEPENRESCPECIAVGGRWVHLRSCLVCGQVGCCDDSPARHATAHYRATGHPLIRSVEPGEGWGWCYEDEVTLRTAEVQAAAR
ncbi:ubiquitin-hydrolase Zn-finger-containing protein [Promicromonospora sp. AC04]|uniref:UBP-type zinc finger domain-containing protein n=1 Tax=Promicromonospora sp. AC04 TaxID=2135723 RepID=UPI000D33DFDB|nr:UBP-type zinc finger domain-containing protein [Promicromonospora sp. AC04]PUB26974.1 ubiquitin-hydrolase Zn-finger-containing protein [Promicromonospora sp. AC04]